MIYKVGLRAKDDTKALTYVHGEAESIQEATDLAEKNTNYFTLVRNMVACSVEETHLKIIRRDG